MDTKSLPDQQNILLEFVTKLPTLALAIDGDGLILELSDQFLKETGYQRDDLVGRPFSHCITEQTGDGADSPSLSFKDIETILDAPSQLIKQDGTNQQVLLSSNLYLDKNGTPLFTLVTVSERREPGPQEIRVEKSERISRTLLEYSPVCTKIVDLDLNLQYMSSAGIKEIQIDDIKEHYGQPYPFSFYPESFKAKMISSLQQAISSATIQELKASVLDLQGNKLWYHSTIVPVLDQQGKTEYLIVISVDITNQMKLEEELRNSLKNLDEVVRAGHVGLWKWDLETDKVSYSEEWKRQLGFEDHEIKDDFSEWQSRVHPEDLESALATVKQSIKEVNNDHRTEFRLRHKDGSYRFIVAQASFITDEDGKPTMMLGSHIDMTEIKKLQSSLYQAQKMESMGTLAGGIAHDFNNILSAMLGFTELAMDDINTKSPLHDDLQEIYSAGLRAKDLVQQILSFARLSEETLEPVQTDTIVKEVLKFIRSTLPSTIEIKQRIFSSASIMANGMQLHRIMMNLCSNAAHAMQKDGGTLEIRLEDVVVGTISPPEARELDPGLYVRITVADTGEGIEPQFLGKIFEPYFTTKPPGDGSGMGLALVYGLVETYGGKIFVNSKPGKGATFKLYIPSAEAQQSQETVQSGILPGGNEHILLVDDEEQIVKYTAKMLTKMGYLVTEKTSSTEALETFRENPGDFDLVISDVTMPKMAGDQLAILLHEIRQDIPIILCSGYTTRIDEQTALEGGVKAFASKPLVKRELAYTVRNVLDG